LKENILKVSELAVSIYEWTGTIIFGLVVAFVFVSTVGSIGRWTNTATGIAIAIGTFLAFRDFFTAVYSIIGAHLYDYSQAIAGMGYDRADVVMVCCLGIALWSGAAVASCYERKKFSIST
jgi:hypothetical protein